MARLATAGAELQSTDRGTEGLATTNAIGTVAISTAIKRSGDASYECGAVSGANAVALGWTAVSGRTFYVRAWFYLPSLPDVTRTIFSVRNGATSNLTITVATDGTLSYVVSGVPTTIGTVSSGSWFCLEVSVNSTTSSTNSTIRLNGTQVATPSYSTASQLQNFVQIGNITATTHATWKIYVDDIALNDDQGSGQTSWPGVLGHVVILRPTADYAVGSDWKLGTGASPSSNAYDAINNVPPLGVSNGAVGSDTKQIRDTVSNATGAAADAEFSYETLSSRVSDAGTVRVMQLVSFTSESNNTPTMSFDATLTNPAGSTNTFNGTQVTATSFPNNWDKFRGPVMVDPSIGLTDTPRARIGKRTATTNAAICCGLLMLVEYDEQTIGVLTGEADAAFGASASSLRGKGNLTGLSSVSFGGSAAALSGAGKTPISGSAAITFSGVVLPPTAKATLVGSSSIIFNGFATRKEALTSTVPISFTAAVVPPTGAAHFAANIPISFSADGLLSLGLPPRVSDAFKDRWASGRHIGAWTPTQIVEIQLGRYNRRYAFFPGGDGIAKIPDRVDQLPWQAFWDASSDWIGVPNVLECTLEGNYDQKGVKQATIQIENIVSEPIVGGGHVFRRGYLSPLRGYTAPSTWGAGDGPEALLDEFGNEVAPNAWANLLNRDVRIRVWQGYGDEMVKTFDGLIDKVTPTSDPDQLTIVARMGKPLTDQRVFGWNHDPYLKDPVMFVGRDEADQITRVEKSVQAISEWAGDDLHGVEMATDSDSETAWRSQAHSDPAVTEWIEIRVPAGRYSDFVFGPEFAGYDIWVSVQAKMVDLVTNATLDGVAITEDVWHDGGSGGTVPGAEGGIAYMTHVTDISATTVVRSLGGEFVMGDDSIIRVSMRNLANASRTAFEPPAYVASARQFFARRRVLNPLAVTQKWLIVEDMADIIRTILLWAGYHDWEVENTGIALPKKLVVNRGMTYMDVIDTVKDAIGFDFFMADPTLADNSLGVPTFRRSRVVTNDAPIATVRDTDLLTAIKVELTDEPLAYIIRTRGRTTSGGQQLGGDASKRLMYTFRPPWADRLGGLLKHIIHKDDLFTSMDDVKFGAFYIALGEALASAQATIEIPAYPVIDLDDQIELLDLGTGLTTRLNARDRKSTFTAGENASWKMTLSGPLIDVPDVQEMVTIINETVRDA